MDEKYKWTYFEKKLYHFRAFHSTIGIDQTVFIIGGLEKFKKKYFWNFFRENIIKLFQDNLAIEVWDGQSDSNFNVTVTNTLLDGWQQYPYLFQLDV